MNIKRIACILLTLVMVLTLAACGGSGSSTPVGNGGTGTSDVDIDTLADAERANFPSPSENYDAVLSTIQMDKKTFDVYLGKMVAAYDNLSDEEFCKYIYELHDYNSEYAGTVSTSILTFMDLLSSEVEEEAATEKKLSSFSATYTEYLALVAAWNVAYLSVGKADDAPSYADLKDEMKPIINTFSNLLYGKDMVF